MGGLAAWRKTEVALWVPPNTPYDDWASGMHALAVMVKSASWWTADALVQGEALYGQAYSAIVDSLGLAPRTLQRLQHLATVFPAERRVEALSISHYEEVALLPAPTQDALLHDAAEHGWSIRDLREQAKLLKADGKAPTSADVAADREVVRTAIEQALRETAIEPTGRLIDRIVEGLLLPAVQGALRRLLGGGE